MNKLATSLVHVIDPKLRKKVGGMSLVARIRLAVQLETWAGELRANVGSFRDALSGRACDCLEPELQELGSHWDARKLRETAAKLERWVHQMRCKADALDGLSQSPDEAEGAARFN